MSDTEFDVLDELYCVTPYHELAKQTALSDEELLPCLHTLSSKKWIKCFLNVSEEALPHEVDLDKHFKEYYYLASKEGLLAHNLG